MVDASIRGLTLDSPIHAGSSSSRKRRRRRRKVSDVRKASAPMFLDVVKPSVFVTYLSTCIIATITITILFIPPPPLPPTYATHA